MFVLLCYVVVVLCSSRNSNSSNNKTSTEGRCCWRGGGGLARSRPGSGKTNIDILKNTNWYSIFTKIYWIFGNHIHPIQKNSTDSRCARKCEESKSSLTPSSLSGLGFPTHLTRGIAVSQPTTRTSPWCFHPRALRAHPTPRGAGGGGCGSHCLGEVGRRHRGRAVVPGPQAVEVDRSLASKLCPLLQDVFFLANGVVIILVV